MNMKTKCEQFNYLPAKYLRSDVDLPSRTVNELLDELNLESYIFNFSRASSHKWSSEHMQAIAVSVQLDLPYLSVIHSYVIQKESTKKSLNQKYRLFRFFVSVG